MNRKAVKVGVGKLTSSFPFLSRRFDFLTLLLANSPELGQMIIWGFLGIVPGLLLLLLFWLVGFAVALAVLVGERTGGAGTPAAPPLFPPTWPTWSLFLSVTNSVLRLFKRCCRWTASFEDASREGGRC